MKKRFKLTPITKRRWAVFKKNKRGYFSMWIFVSFFMISLFAEIIANDKPLLIIKDHKFYFPAFLVYTEKEFGGYFETEADYTDPEVEKLIQKESFIIYPPIKFSFDTINFKRDEVFPAPPSSENLLGTDDHGRDILVRLIYGFRVSVIFGLSLSAISSIIGIIVGAIQGYYGGKVDMIGQRFMEIWSGLPMIYVLIIISSFMEPGFLVVLGIMLLFSWMGLVDVVRAEFLKCRNLEYVNAARAMGLSDKTIIFRHVLPNAFVSAITFLPFILNGSITTLTSLDFLGFGLPPGSPALGELLAQGKTNLHAPWIGISAFLTLASTLSLLVFIGEGLRDAFDPRNNI